MEHIQKALEKAKAERQLFPKGNKDIQNNDQLENIVYTKTRTEPADPAVLVDNRIITAQSDDPRAVSFHILRTQVLRKLRQENWNTLAITAATAGAGKSLVAANLAISMAHEVNQTVLLVDLDLRRPSIHKYFGLEPDIGVPDYLKEDIDLSTVLVNPGIDRLVLLPGKGRVTRSSELLTTPKMNNLLKELKIRYKSRYIIIDLPPLLETDDAIAFLPLVECTLFVVASGETTDIELKNAKRLLEGTNLLGSVFNKSDQKAPAYY